MGKGLLLGALLFGATATASDGLVLNRNCQQELSACLTEDAAHACLPKWETCLAECREDAKIRSQLTRHASMTIAVPSLGAAYERFVLFFNGM